MPWKKHTPEQIIALLRQIEAKIANGKSISKACKESQITTKTHYRWRRMCLFKGVPKLDLIRQLKPSNKRLQLSLPTSMAKEVRLVQTSLRGDRISLLVRAFTKKASEPRNIVRVVSVRVRKERYWKQKCASLRRNRTER